MTKISLVKRLSVYAGLLCGAWGVGLGILYFAGLKGVLLVACLIAAVLLLVAGWRAAGIADAKEDALARENDAALRQRINRSQVSNGKRGTAA